jgi:hypothetical protein
MTGDLAKCLKQPHVHLELFVTSKRIPDGTIQSRPSAPLSDTPDRDVNTIFRDRAGDKSQLLELTKSSHGLVVTQSGALGDGGQRELTAIVLVSIQGKDGIDGKAVRFHLSEVGLKDRIVKGDVPLVVPARVQNLEGSIVPVGIGV